MQQSSGQLQAAFHAAGIGTHEIVALVPEVDHLEHLLDTFVTDGFGHVVDHGVKAQVVQTGKPIVEAGILED